MVFNKQEDVWFFCRKFLTTNLCVITQNVCLFLNEFVVEYQSLPRVGETNGVQFLYLY